MEWNFGDMLDRLAGVVPPENPALIHGDRVITWKDFDRRTNNLARAFLENGAQTGDKVGFYLRNRPAYMETFAACFKARLVHVNVNYRYRESELAYIFDNSDAQTVVYESDFRDQIDNLKSELPKVKTWVEVPSTEGVEAEQSLSYEKLAETGDGTPLGLERSPQDLLFLYTGGTTGMPKGVMWPQGVLRETQLDGLRALGMEQNTWDDYLSNAQEMGVHAKQIPACPLMHGTGLFTALGVMINGGCIITLANTEKFDPEELCATIDKHKVTNLAIVGDAFAKPILAVLEGSQNTYDVSSVASVVSSGVMWSSEVKRGLLKHMPTAVMTDAFGSSEAVGFGSSMMTADGEVKTAKFEIGEKCKVFTPEGVEVQPGSGVAGFIARGGAIPLGYYKDQEKTDKTYKTINGERYAIPGDWCTVEEDGTLTLLGRGSVCINTAGEKVYPEEVEEVLKEIPEIEDALVVGLPDEKWGQAVTAVVQPISGADCNEASVRDFVREKLAGYKVPKRVLFKENLGRAPNGKADYKGITAYATEQLG